MNRSSGGVTTLATRRASKISCSSTPGQPAPLGDRERAAAEEIVEQDHALVHARAPRTGERCDVASACTQAPSLSSSRSSARKRSAGTLPDGSSALERVPLEERRGALLVERIVVEDAPALSPHSSRALTSLGFVARGERDHAIERVCARRSCPLTACAR